MFLMVRRSFSFTNYFLILFLVLISWGWTASLIELRSNEILKSLAQEQYDLLDVLCRTAPKGLSKEFLSISQIQAFLAKRDFNRAQEEIAKLESIQKKVEMTERYYQSVVSYYIGQKDFTNAASWYEDGKELLSEEFKNKVQVLILENTGRYDEALKILEDREPPDKKLIRARIFQKQGLYNKSVAQLSDYFDSINFSYLKIETEDRIIDNAVWPIPKWCVIGPVGRSGSSPSPESSSGSGLDAYQFRYRVVSWSAYSAYHLQYQVSLLYFTGSSILERNWGPILINALITQITTKVGEAKLSVRALSASEELDSDWLRTGAQSGTYKISSYDNPPFLLALEKKGNEGSSFTFILIQNKNVSFVVKEMESAVTLIDVEVPEEARKKNFFYLECSSWIKSLIRR